MKEMRYSYGIFIENLIGRYSQRWNNNIKINLKVIGCENVHWIDMVQDRVMWRVVVNAVMNIQVL
jgi:hypothetical protein